MLTASIASVTTVPVTTVPVTTVPVDAVRETSAVRTELLAASSGNPTGAGARPHRALRWD